MPPEFDPARQFIGAVIFCPVCCTNVDADEYGEQSFECLTCGTKFTVNIDPQIIATHARYG